jgi:purine-binding chemotaxis protein CheW
MQQHSKSHSSAAAPGEYLSFRLGDEEYGIDILRVQEIRGYEPPTRIANAPAFIKGVVNLRGTIVPIVDLRLKFGLGDAQYNGLTVVIVLNVARRVVGIVVDAVSDVLALTAEQIKPAPAFGKTLLDASHVTGLGCVPGTDGERLLILTDIERLMSAPEMGLVEAEATV